MEYRDCTKTKGTSVGCKCSTELVFCMTVCNALSLQQINISVYACTHEKNLIL